MKTFIQIVLVIVLIITLIWTVGEAHEHKSLSQQLSAICTAAVIALGVSFFA